MVQRRHIKASESISQKTFKYLVLISLVIGLVMVAIIILQLSNYFSRFTKYHNEYNPTCQEIIEDDEVIPNSLKLKAFTKYAVSDFIIFAVQSFLFALVLTLPLALLLSYSLSKKIGKPIDKLLKTLDTNIKTSGFYYQTIKPEGPQEIINLIEKYNQLIKKLNRIEKARQDLISDISHELRTPITKMSLTLKAFLDRVLKPNKTNLKTLQLELEHLSRLIERIQLIAEVTEQPLRRVSIKLKPFVKEIINGYNHDAKRIECDIPKDYKIKADKTKLKELIDNLISNALKFSPPDTKVEIGLKNNCLYVKDHGPGITKKELNKIFKRFYRTKEAINKRIKGSGLGLAIVKEIADAHGWRIKVKSKVGKGTTFLVCF